MKKINVQLTVKLLIISLFTSFLLSGCFRWYLYSDQIADAQEEERQELIAEEEVNVQ